MKVVELLTCESVSSNCLVIRQIEETDGTLLLFLTFLVSPTEDMLPMIERVIRDIMGQIWTRRIMYHLIIDTSFISSVSFQTALCVNEVLKERKEMISLLLHSTVFVVKNHLIRSIANKVFMLFPPTKPLKFFVPTIRTGPPRRVDRDGRGSPDTEDAVCGASHSESLSSNDSLEILKFLRENRKTQRYV
tara:strand:+ start:1416 stop:1985 length:570 start_codon:yes stop_codon:yes gene_type:complete